MSDADQDLLRRFARDHAQDAFTEIVRRHVNLVYSAARRQVRSPQLAEEVAQSVFSDLARNAGRLCAADGPLILTAWLYQVAHHTAVDVVRRESRRQLREQIAVEMNAMNTTEAAWPDIEPFLDDAMQELEPADRAAVLLRYFENQSFRDVGAQLGLSEDAAQKRVSRAVEKLRDCFSRRKIIVGAGGLIALVSANAVQSAPIGLAAGIAAAALAGTAVTASTIIATTTKTIAMTMLQKTLVTAAVAVLAGAGIYQAKQAHVARAEAKTLRQQQAPLAEQIRQLQSEHETATNSIAWLNAELAKNESNNIELLQLRGEMGILKRQLEDSQRSNGLLQAARNKNPSQTSDTEIKAREENKCLNNLRQIDAAMQQYALEHNLSETSVVTAQDILPFLPNAQIPQCPSGGTYTFGKLNEVPSCSTPGHALPPSVASPAMELKFGMLKSAIEKDRFAAITSADIKSAVQRYKQFHNGQSPQSQGEWLLYLTAYGPTFQSALEAYMNAHNNQAPTNAVDLLPYWQK